MITQDLDRALAATNGPAGTWRPAPAPGAGTATASGTATPSETGAASETTAGSEPGTYASTIAFERARIEGAPPARIAARLAERLRGLDWVQDASVTGGGYLTVRVTPDALAMLAVRITLAGPACARSDALRGRAVTAPGGPAPAAASAIGQARTWEQARTWDEARDGLARLLTGRLAEAAGADVTWEPPPGPEPPPGREPAPGPRTDPGPRTTPRAETSTGLRTPPGPEQAPGPRTPLYPRTAPGPEPDPAAAAEPDPAVAAEPAPAATSHAEPFERPPSPDPPAPPAASPVAGAIAFAGEAAVILALCLLPPGAPAAVDQRAAAAHDLRNPAYAVRYAHAHAASILRQAADLGLERGEAAGFRPRLLAHPREQALLGTMSWLPERVAGAARRGQPYVLARYLAELAGAYLDCHRQCPAVWPGALRPGGPVPAVIPARLWLTEAARTALAAGLSLLGVTAESRL